MLGQPFAILRFSCDIGTYRLNWPRGQCAHFFLLIGSTCICSAEAVPVYLAEPDHEREHSYQETVVDNVVVPHHLLLLYFVLTTWEKIPNHGHYGSPYRHHGSPY